MPDVRMLFWRAVTLADFFNVERAPGVGPATGGGQRYFSISFSGLSHSDLGRFLGVNPPNAIQTTRPVVTLAGVAAIQDLTRVADVEFAPRYQLPQPGDRYKISRQNRQAPADERHPAWTAEFGFPQAPDDVASKDDPRMPDITYLKLYLARLDDDSYVAGFFNADMRPAPLPDHPGLTPVFAPRRNRPGAGLLEFAAGELPRETLTLSTLDAVSPNPEPTESPEVQDALDEVRALAGRRPSGQGRRQSAAERLAIERRAIAVATAHLQADGWAVKDVGSFRSYDLHCEKHGSVLRVEVKGTTGAGTSLLLTRNEVDHARDNYPDVGLIVVSAIKLAPDPVTGKPVASAGNLEEVNPWDIDAQGELRPTGYEYRRH